MSATGSLTTKMFVSPDRPTARTQAGYQALNSRTITPSGATPLLGTGFLLAAGATAGDTDLSLDQGATTFTVTADQYVGATFTLPGDDTVYMITAHDAKATDNVTAVDFTITPGLAEDAADNAALTQVDDSSLILAETDYAAVVSGDEVTISAALAPLATGTTYYLFKRGSSKVSFAATPEEARTKTEIVITGTFGTQTLGVSNWKPLGELTNVDEFGRQYEVVRANNLADGATRKAKGSYDNGSVPFETLFDARDGGQVIMEEALKSTLNYAFRIDVPPDTDGGSGPTYYLQALVTSFRPRIGGPNDMTMMRGNLEIDHNDPVVA